MRFMSEQTRAARAALRAARADLDRVAEQDAEGYRWYQEVPESDEFLAANDRVIEAEKALPWWKRLDVDHTDNKTDDHAADADEM
jgi:hypothetical protein